LTHYAKGTSLNSDCFSHIISRSFHSIFYGSFHRSLTVLFTINHWIIFLVWGWFPQFSFFFSFTFFTWFGPLFNTGHFSPVSLTDTFYKRVGVFDFLLRRGTYFLQNWSPAYATTNHGSFHFFWISFATTFHFSVDFFSSY